MLSLEEKANVVELLSGLPDLSDLISLAVTITNGLLKPETKEDAIEAIVLHSANLEQVLSRKKVSKELLFNYIHWKKIPTPGTHDKVTLIKLIIDYWRRLPESKEETGTVDIAIQGPIAETFALQFCEWFFKLYNTDIAEEGLKPEHFWQDCTITLCLSSNNNDISEEAFSSEGVVHLLKQIKINYNLYFYPNLCPEGVQTKCQPNGLVAVLACGTLHQTIGNVFGIFELMFLLLKDPFACGNWKIKTIKAKLTSCQNIIAMPVLKDCELGNVLALEN